MSKEIPREKYVSLEGKQKIVVNYNSLIKEYKKIINLLYNSLNKTTKFSTKNWVEINNDST